MAIYKASCITEELYHKVVDTVFVLSQELATNAANVSKLIKLSKMIVKDAYIVIKELKTLNHIDFLISTYCAMFKDTFNRLKNIYAFTIPQYRHTEMESLLINGYDKIFDILEAFTVLRFRFMFKPNNSYTLRD